MNKELIQEWVTALRSGNYKQTRFQLRDVINNSFCVIGVACEIAKMDWNDYFFDHNELMPAKIMYQYGIECEEFSDLLYEIVNLNDIDRFNFNELADFIEQKLLLDNAKK